MAREQFRMKGELGLGTWSCIKVEDHTREQFSGGRLSNASEKGN